MNAYEEQLRDNINKGCSINGRWDASLTVYHPRPFLCPHDRRNNGYCNDCAREQVNRIFPR